MGLTLYSPLLICFGIAANAIFKYTIILKKSEKKTNNNEMI